MPNDALQPQANNGKINSFSQEQDKIVGEIKQEAQRYVDTAKNTLSNAKDQVLNKGQEILDDVKQKTDDARETMSDTFEKVDDYTRKNPWPVVAIAALAGATLALLFSKGVSRSCKRHRLH